MMPPVADSGVEYLKILKISPRAYMFQRPFLRGLFFGEAYKLKEICISKLARLILGGKYASQSPSGQLVVGRKFVSAQ